MQTYEILVQNRAVKANSQDMTLVRTSVGIDQVHILFDNSEWLDFPISITFAQGDELVSQTLVVSEVTGSDEWVAEATVTVPYEVIDMTGSIRVTLQGTDAEGRHIITARGTPLSVEEAGDVVMGDVPSDAPTVDQWQQAYAQAMAAVNEAAGLVSTLRAELDAMVSDAKEDVDDKVADAILPATTERIGSVIVGDGLDVTEDGRVSVTSMQGLTQAQASQLANIARLAYYCFDTEFDDNGALRDNAKMKARALPVAGIDELGAIMADNVTITVDENGFAHAKQYVLPIATTQMLGGVMIDGSTVTMRNGVLSVPVGTTQKPGILRPDGTTISVTSNGVITATGGGGDGGYILPVATETQLGGVRVDGDTIRIDSNGIIRIALGSADGTEF